MEAKVTNPGFGGVAIFFYYAFVAASVALFVKFLVNSVGRVVTLVGKTVFFFV